MARLGKEKDHQRPRRMRKPRTMKSPPETRRMRRKGRCSPRSFPASTPRAVVLTRARAAPRKTQKRCELLAARRRVASWVLSPSSARKTVRKAAQKTLSIFLSGEAKDQGRGKGAGGKERQPAHEPQCARAPKPFLPLLPPISLGLIFTPHQTSLALDPERIPDY